MGGDAVLGGVWGLIRGEIWARDSGVLEWAIDSGVGFGRSASSNSLLSRGSSPGVRRSPRRTAVVILGRTASWWGLGDAEGKLRGRRAGFYIFSMPKLGEVFN